jgi:RHS repeat-associated protein
MQTRTVNTMNQLTQMGGAGDVVAAGHVNERSAVTVNGQAAVIQADPVSTGFLFRKPISVTPGSNTVEISAVDEDDPPNTTTQSWSFTVPPPQRSFEYDASGNCPSLRSRPAGSLRNVDAAVAAKQWHDNEIVQERVGTSATAGTISRNHYYGGFTIGATVSTAAKYQTFTDHLGHVREVVAASGTNPAIGTVLTRYEYSPCQGPTKVYQFPSTNVEATFQTIGRYYHHEASGLELALYRAYDAELGRWISEDPLGEEGGLNLYGFVGNGPIRQVDLNGHCPALAVPAGYAGGTAIVSTTAGTYLVNVAAAVVVSCVLTSSSKKPWWRCKCKFEGDQKLLDAGAPRFSFGEGPTKQAAQQAAHQSVREWGGALNYTHCFCYNINR